MDQQAPTINDPPIVKKITGILQSKPVILQFFKFAGIGFLTTAVDFLLFNILSKVLQVNAGMPLAIINIFTFVLALAHSFVWNANWTFNNHQAISELKIFAQSIIIGTIGVIGVLLSVVGGKVMANYTYYVIILLVLICVEVVLWKSFALVWFADKTKMFPKTILTFILVSVIGASINSGLVGLVTKYYPLTDNLDLNKNLAKVFANAISLIWNFVGYRILVFKKPEDQLR
jgi:putative flippase GtrA